MHQQHSVLLRGSERQLLALWVTQLKMAVLMKSNPHFGESIMEKKALTTQWENYSYWNPKGVREIQKADFIFVLTSNSSCINQSNGINLFLPGQNYTSSVIQCQVGYPLINVLARIRPLLKLFPLSVQRFIRNRFGPVSFWYDLITHQNVNI